MIFQTWMMIRLSTWIVGHSGIQDKMISEGATFENFLVDWFFHTGYFAMIPAEAIAGITALVFLALPLRKK